MKRREFLKNAAGVTGGLIAAQNLKAIAQSQAEAGASSGGQVVIDPKPLFDISPHLYMQFMEPLGVTDSSVEAAWDYNHDDWRKDFIDTTQDLAPGMMRFGGLFSRYYKWREGVGPAAKRPLDAQLRLGRQRNQSRRHARVRGLLPARERRTDVLRQLSRATARSVTPTCPKAIAPATPAKPPTGSPTPTILTTPSAKPTAHAAPFNLKFWQLGNETSYGNACFQKRGSHRGHRSSSPKRCASATPRSN